MQTNEETAPPPEAAPVAINWREIARSALGSALVAGIVGGALHVLGKVIEAEANVEGIERDAAPALYSDEAHDAHTQPQTEYFADDCATDEGVPDDEATQAAELLGVPLDASEDDIRAALRSHLTLTRIHPDEGGDEEEAKKLIAAKNLLIERARAARP